MIKRKPTTHTIAKDELIAMAEERVDTSKFFRGAPFELSTNDWERGEMNRTHIDIVRFTGMGRLAERVKCGYFDNKTGEYVVNPRDYDVVEDWYE